MFAARRKRRHGKRLAARSLENVGGVVAGNADFPFGLFVVRLEILVADRPIVQRAAGHRAVGRAHAKVFFHETPRHGAVTERAAAHARGVVAVLAIARQNDLLVAIGSNDHAGIALVVGPEGAAQSGGALVAQIVLAAIERGVPFAAFEQRYGQTGVGELLGDNAAARARSNHDSVYTFEGHGREPSLLSSGMPLTLLIVLLSADLRVRQAHHFQLT